jgi:zinc protease
MVVAGDFDPKATLEGIKASFGSIPSHGKPRDPGAPGFDPNVTTLKSVVRETMEDNVELSRVTMAWQSPKRFAPGDAELGLLGIVLSKGTASRLYGALVYQKKLAQSVQVVPGSRVRGSVFQVEVTARPGVSLETLEAAIDGELKKVTSAPVSEGELTRAKNAIETGFVARLERVADRAEILNEYEAMLGDPGYAPRDLERYRGVTAEGIRAVASKVIDLKARVVLRVVPRKKAPAGKSDATKPGAVPATKAVTK